MNRLAKIVQSATPSRRIQFRRNKYGKSGAREFLRDLMAMANADVDGSRYIIVGAGFDSSGHKQLDGVGRDDFAGKPSYLALAGEFIEPAVRLKYESVIIDDTRVGAYEIGDCPDRRSSSRECPTACLQAVLAGALTASTIRAIPGLVALSSSGDNASSS